jgi:hypothetical protein
MFKCATPNCHAPAKSSCSGCGREQYCSSECQKKDWKKHKLMCPMLKKLSYNLQPYNEVGLVIEEIEDLAIDLTTALGEDDVPSQIRVLNHLLIYAEYQFGVRVVGKSYHEGADGGHISNWDVEIEIFYDIVDRLTILYSKNKVLSCYCPETARNDLIFASLEKTRSILNPWIDCLDRAADSLIESLDKDQTSNLLDYLRKMEQEFAMINMNRKHYNIADKNCERVLYYSRKREDNFGKEKSVFPPYEEYELQEKKTTEIFEALRTYCSLRLEQNDRTGAKSFAEEAYDLVAVAYNPVHPQVSYMK